MSFEESSQVPIPPALSLSDLHSNMLTCIIAFLDWPSRLAFSLCCRRIRTVVFDPSAWPRLVLGQRATDKSISLVRAIYANKRTALTHLKLHQAQVTEPFFSQLNAFLGEENSVKILKVRACSNIGRLDLAFPLATHITVLGTLSSPSLHVPINHDIRARSKL